MQQHPTRRAHHARQRCGQPELGATKSGRKSTVQLFELPPKTSCGQRAQIARARELRAANDLLKRWQGAPFARPAHHRSNPARVRRPKSAPDSTAEARSSAQINEGGRSRRTRSCHPTNMPPRSGTERRHRANQARTARVHSATDHETS